MIKLRFLKLRTQQVYQQLESVDIPSIEDLNDLNIVTTAIGKILNKYSELIADPNMISSLLDGTITDWNIRDIESIQASLSLSGLMLTFTEEDQEDVALEARDLIYLIIDNSVKLLGVIPTAKFLVIKSEATGVDVVAIYKVVAEFYFNANKFKINPIQTLLNNLDESKRLVGGYDQYSLSKLNSLLYYLNKSLIVITIV